MPWSEAPGRRTASGKTWKNGSQRIYQGVLGTRLHYGADLSQEVNFSPQRLIQGGFDGWVVDQSPWTYALGARDGMGDGWNGAQIGARRLWYRLARFGWFHWPDRGWESISGTPTYNRANLTSQTPELVMGPAGAEVSLYPEAISRWDGVFTTPNGGAVNVEWVAEGTRVKEEIVITQDARDWVQANAMPSDGTWAAADTYFTMLFQLDGVGDFNWNIDPADGSDVGGRIQLRDAVGDLLFYMPIDRAWVGENRLDGIRLYKRVFTNAQGVWLAVGARMSDLGGLAAGDLRFDPTLNSQPDGTAGKDTWLYSFNASTNYGGDGNLPKYGSNIRSLVQFDYSSIPTGSTVDSANVELMQNTGSSGYTFNLARIVRAWVEAEATWNIASTGVNWSTAGCNNDGSDYDSTPTSTATAQGPGNWATWNDANLITLIQNIVDGTYTNEGFRLWASGDIEYFYSSDHGTAADRPKTSVTYTEPVTGVNINAATGAATATGQAATLSTGVVYYVDATNGDDTANGLTEGTAWQTVGKVNNTTLNPGDTVLFKRGEVWTDAILRLNHDGTASQPITYGAYGTGNRPRFAPSGVNMALYSSALRQHWVIEHLEFDGTNVNTYAAQILVSNAIVDDCVFHSAPNTGLFFQDGSDSTIRNCIAYGNGNFGIQLYAGSGVTQSNNVVEDCTAYNNGSGTGDQGIYVAGHTGTSTGHIIRRNTCYGNGDGGIKVNSADNCEVRRNRCYSNSHGIILSAEETQSATGNVIANNVCYENNGAGLEIICDVGSPDGQVDSNLIYNNTFVRNAAAGGVAGILFLSADAATGNTFYNNVVYQDNNDSSTDGPMRLTGTNARDNNTFNYNLYFWANRGNTDIIYVNGVGYYSLSGWQALGHGANSLNADPQFVDMPTDNYDLLGASPAVNAGVDTSPTVTIDYDGVNRPVGSAYDIGAYEYEATLTTIPAQTGTLTAAGLTSVVFQDVTLTANAGALTAAGQTASVAAGQAAVAAQTGQLVSAGLAGAVLPGQATVAALVGQLLAAGQPAGAVKQFQVMPPIADSFVGLWTTDQGASTGLYTRIDEAEPDNVDFIQSEQAPANSPVVFQAAAAVDPETGQGYRFSYTIRRDGPSTAALTVELREAYVSEASPGTLIASWAHADVPTTWTRYDQELSQAEADGIGNHQDLYYRFVAAT